MTVCSSPHKHAGALLSLWLATTEKHKIIGAQAKDFQELGARLLLGSGHAASLWLRRLAALHAAWRAPPVVFHGGQPPEDHKEAHSQWETTVAHARLTWQAWRNIIFHINVKNQAKSCQQLLSPFPHVTAYPPPGWAATAATSIAAGAAYIMAKGGLVETSSVCTVGMA